MRLNGKIIEVTQGSLKGEKGYYLGSDGYTGAGVVCKLLIDDKPISLRWDYFRFTDPEAQQDWENEEFDELDFVNMVERGQY